MRIQNGFVIAVSLLMPSGWLYSQQQQPSYSHSVVAMKSEFQNGDYANVDSLQFTWTDTCPQNDRWLGLPSKAVCKNIHLEYAILSRVTSGVNDETESLYEPLSVDRSPMLQVRGNVMYDVNYRSQIDTPYAQNDVYQHTIQTRLDLLYRGKYPFKVYLTSHFSNSPLLRDYASLNFRYLQVDFKRIVKEKLMAVAERYVDSHTRQLDSLRHLIEGQKLAIALLAASVEKPNVTQQMVEERERSLFERRQDKQAMFQMTQPPAAVALSSGESKFLHHSFHSGNALSQDAGDTARISKYLLFIDSLQGKKSLLDSLISKLANVQQLYGTLKSEKELNLAQVRHEIDVTKEPRALSEKLKQYHIPDSVLPKGYKTFYAIRSVNLGRAFVNYSELSVKNISITGFQAELNPHYYYAFAAGRVDYRFRDYVISNSSKSGQYLALFRVGKGMQDGNHIILTGYTGKRQFFNSGLSSSAGFNVPSYHLAGITLEGFYKLNKNVLLVAEIAKSTVPYYILDSSKRREWMHSFTQFKSRNNEAYSISANAYFPKTSTILAGKLKYLGANFQSFSTFTTGSSQLRWSAKLEQPFFKRKITLVSSLQKDDYNSYYATANYNSTALLASFQATLRLKNWPYISAGFYPSYQLTKIGENHFSENRYYTLIANGGYFYHLNALKFSTYVVFSKFYNSADDSGFVYFNAKSLLVSQTATVKRFFFQLDGSVSVNTGYNIYTVENSAQISLNNSFSIGAGLKMVQQSLLSSLLYGYSGNVKFKIPKIGDFQLTMNKGFIPGLNRTLTPNNIGRLTYLETF